VCRRHLVTTDVLRGTLDGQERRAEGGGRSTVRKTVVGPCIKLRTLDGARRRYLALGWMQSRCLPPAVDRFHISAE
jgi:hypothetical protein